MLVLSMWQTKVKRNKTVLDVDRGVSDNPWCENDHITDEEKVLYFMPTLKEGLWIDFFFNLTKGRIMEN